MSDNPWTQEALESRISDRAGRMRYEAASPNTAEIEVYASFLPPVMRRSIVLGMTPELRLLAATRCRECIAVERNPASIAMFKAWLPDHLSSRETVVQDNWQSLCTHVSDPVDAVLGDGVFGNLLSLDDHETLLSNLRKCLAPTGVFVTRHALAPGFEIADHVSHKLVALYRSGRSDSAEFGFDLRMLGYWREAYDPERYILDNSHAFRLIDADVAAGKLSAEERAVSRRYFFPGQTLLLPQRKWEDLLAKMGFTFEVRFLEGKSWYRYYPIYQCRPR